MNNVKFVSYFSMYSLRATTIRSISDLILCGPSMYNLLLACASASRNSSRDLKTYFQISFPDLHRPTSCATRVLRGVKWLLEHGCPSREQAVRDRGVRASCVGTRPGKALLTIRTPHHMMRRSGARTRIGQKRLLDPGETSDRRLHQLLMQPPAQAPD